MRAEILAAGMLVASSVVGVRLFDLSEKAPAASAAPARDETLLAASAQAEPAAYQSNWGGEVKIEAARDHQFYVTAAVNNVASSFLIDTGASFVALRDSDARLAGIYTAWADFNRSIRTANGETKAALVTLDAVEIDGLRVEHVPAFILPDDQLSINLLGMSFLSKLKSVEAHGEELVLKG